MPVLKDDEVIIFRKEDGGVAIINMHPGAGLTVEAIVARVVPSGDPWKVIKKNTLPPEGQYRDAWDWED